MESSETRKAESDGKEYFCLRHISVLSDGLIYTKEDMLVGSIFLRFFFSMVHVSRVSWPYSYLSHLNNYNIT